MSALSAPSSLIERERERPVERMLRRRLRDPAPALDRARRADVDEVVRQLGAGARDPTPTAAHDARRRRGSR